MTINRFERMTKQMKLSLVLNLVGISVSGADISVGEVKNVLKK